MQTGSPLDQRKTPYSIDVLLTCGYQSNQAVRLAVSGLETHSGMINSHLQILFSIRLVFGNVKRSGDPIRITSTVSRAFGQQL